MEFFERFRALPKWNSYLVKDRGRTVSYIDLLGSVDFVIDRLDSTKKVLVEPVPCGRAWGMYQIIVTRGRLKTMFGRIKRHYEGMGYSTRFE